MYMLNHSIVYLNTLVLLHSSNADCVKTFIHKIRGFDKKARYVRPIVRNVGNVYKIS